METVIGAPVDIAIVLRNLGIQVARSISNAFNLGNGANFNPTTSAASAIVDNNAALIRMLEKESVISGTRVFLCLHGNTYKVGSSGIDGCDASEHRKKSSLERNHFDSISRRV